MSSNKTFIKRIFALIAITALFSAPLIFLPQVIGGTEAREIHTARIIYSTNEWVLPLRNGVIPSKPPLLHWLSAVLGGLFGGVSPFVVRLVSAIAGCGVLLLTGLISLRAATLAYSAKVEREAWNACLPILAVIILSTSYFFFRLMCDARVDMVFAFFVVLALYASLNGKLLPTRNPCLRHPLPQWGLFYFACGFAVLAKGPLGLILPLLITFVSSAIMLGLRKSLIEFLRPRTSWLLFLFISLSWYLAAYSKGGDAFLWRVLHENIDRLLGTLNGKSITDLVLQNADQHALGVELPDSSFLYYLPRFLFKAAPWSFLFFAFIIRDCVYLSRLEKIKGSAEIQHARLLFALWFFIGFCFFSLAAGKRSSYLLPLLPSVSIFVAWHLIDCWHSAGAKLHSSLEKLLMLETWTLLLLSICSLIFIWAVLPHLSLPGKTGEAAINWLFQHQAHISFSFVFAALCCVFSLRTHQINFRSFASWAALVSMLFVWASVGMSLKADFKAFPKAANIIRSASKPDKQVVLIREGRDEYFDPVMLYLDADVKIQQIGHVKWDSKNIYFSKQALLEQIKQNARQGGLEIEVLGEHRQPVDFDTGKTDRNIIILQLVSK